MRITVNSILDAWRIEPTLTYAGFEAAPRPAMRKAIVAVQFKRRNRRLHGARGEYWSSYAEFRPLQVTR